MGAHFGPADGVVARLPARPCNIEDVIGTAEHKMLGNNNAGGVPRYRKTAATTEGQVLVTAAISAA